MRPPGDEFQWTREARGRCRPALSDVGAAVGEMGVVGVAIPSLHNLHRLPHLQEPRRRGGGAWIYDGSNPRVTHAYRVDVSDDESRFPHTSRNLTLVGEGEAAAAQSNLLREWVAFV